MNRAVKLRWFGLGALAVLGLQAAFVVLIVIGVSRRPEPVATGKVDPPWGTVDLEATAADPSSGLEDSMLDSFREEDAATYDADGDGVRTYHLLSLSGGGSNGAYGAGLLCGWTDSGTRPEFKIVTGVSTGSLQATCAFLGSEYDYIAKEVFTKYTTSEIYTKRYFFSPLINDAMADTAPLKGLIDHYLTPEILEKVAAEHDRGRRLYVGTSNIDSGEFVIWDMGEIASSGKPDALERFRKVLLASCSIPVFFPPVYMEVESDGKTAYEMHVDGGTHALAFFRGFMLEFDDAKTAAGIRPGTTEEVLYVIRNGTLSEDADERRIIEPRGVLIGGACVQAILDMITRSSFYRMYLLCRRYQIDFNLAAIPDEYADRLEMTEFDPKATKALFDIGYEQAKQGYDWRKMPVGLDPDEIVAPPARTANR